MYGGFMKATWIDMAYDVETVLKYCLQRCTSDDFVAELPFTSASCDITLAARGW